jgi:predicted DNA-binding protein
MILKKDSHAEYAGQAISLKLPSDLLATADRCSTALGMSRARYIRAAIERINRDTLAVLRSSRLEEVSRRVRKDSTEINNGMRVLQKQNNG